jgi:rhodanese-related sulfurtransferase
MTFFSQQPKPYSEIDVASAREMINSGKDVVVLDVRTEEEYWSETGHIKNSILIPIDDLSNRVRELENCKSKTILVFCYAGQRSMMGCKILASHGFGSLYNVMGGMMEWCDANYEVEGVNQPPPRS